MKAVCFDLDGTLIRFRPVEQIVGGFLEERGFIVDPATVRSALSDLERPKIEGIDPEEYYVKLNHSILKRLGFEDYDLAAELLRYWFEKKNYAVYPDVREGVSRIRELGCKIGIASNNLSWEVEKFLRENELYSMFDVIVSPDKVGAFKPNREFFMEASRMFEVDVRHMLHVGNDLEEDYLGAIRAGIKALLLDREGRLRAGLRDVPVIRGLGEVYLWLVEEGGRVV